MGEPVALQLGKGGTAVRPMATAVRAASTATRLPPGAPHCPAGLRCPLLTPGLSPPLTSKLEMTRYVESWKRSSENSHRPRAESPRHERRQPSHRAHGTLGLPPAQHTPQTSASPSPRPPPPASGHHKLNAVSADLPIVKARDLSSQSYGFLSNHIYGCMSWTIKKAEHRRTDAFELWCWRRLLRVSWTARRSNQSILKISPGCSLEGLMLKPKLQSFGHLM